MGQKLFKGIAVLSVFSLVFLSYWQAAHAATVIFLTDTSATTWTVPSDWNNSNNKIEVLSAGGGGTNATPSHVGVTGGSAAYSASTNLTLTPGSTVGIKVGAGGVHGGSSTGGGDTYICSDNTGNCSDSATTGGTFGSSVIVAAHGGPGATDGVGGLAASTVGAVGTTKIAGPVGGVKGSDATGGAGSPGASGPNGVGCLGGDGSSGSGGSGGGGADAGSCTNGQKASAVAGNGGTGPTGSTGGLGATSGVNATSGSNGAGAGGGFGGGATGACASGTNEPLWDSTHGPGGGSGGGAQGATGCNGALYGAAGSGAGFSNHAGGDGAQGIIVITYTPRSSPTTPPVPSTQMIGRGDRIIGKGVKIYFN